MKEIIISGDGDSVVYSVPDDVANHLTSPHAKRYRIKGVYCYNEAHFIDYLNEFAFPEQKSVLVKNLGWTGLGKELPPEYRNHPYFNF